MNNNLIIRIDKQLKDDFRKAAAAENPAIPEKRAMSYVLRQLMIDYVRQHKEKRRYTPK